MSKIVISKNVKGKGHCANVLQKYLFWPISFTIQHLLMQTHQRLIRFGYISQNQVLSPAVIKATTKKSISVRACIVLNGCLLFPRSL